LVIDAINSELKCPGVPFDDVAACEELERGFAAKSRNQVSLVSHSDPSKDNIVEKALRGAIGALDGCIFWQHSPGVAVENPNRYYCARKCKFAILASAICDSERRFLWFDMSSTPSTHDHSAFRKTNVGSRIYNGDLPRPFFLLGKQQRPNERVFSRRVCSCLYVYTCISREQFQNEKSDIDRRRGIRRWPEHDHAWRRLPLQLRAVVSPH
jgi:hypothetical protein